jgi:hypothetical protein
MLLLVDNEKGLKMYHRQNPLHLSYTDFSFIQITVFSGR